MKVFEIEPNKNCFTRSRKRLELTHEIVVRGQPSCFYFLSDSIPYLNPCFSTPDTHIHTHIFNTIEINFLKRLYSTLRSKPLYQEYSLLAMQVLYLYLKIPFKIQIYDKKSLIFKPFGTNKFNWYAQNPFLVVGSLIFVLSIIFTAIFSIPSCPSS